MKLGLSSKSLSSKGLGIAELETLAAVWMISQYHALMIYIYGHKVVVMTDHPAVKSVLETSSPNGKHARWWTKMFNLEVLNNYVLSSWKSIATLSNLLAPNLNMAFK